VCSLHFAGGKPSSDETSPDYVPSIFPVPQRVYESVLRTKPPQLEKKEKEKEKKEESLVRPRATPIFPKCLGM
jgi:hypothetical protein